MKPETMNKQFRDLDIELFFTIAGITCSENNMERLKNNGLTTVRKLLNNLDSCRIRVNTGNSYKGNEPEYLFLFEVLYKIEMKISTEYERHEIIQKYREHFEWKRKYVKIVTMGSLTFNAIIHSLGV